MPISTATLDQAVIETLVSAATLAPSVHNSQPWSFAAGRQTIEVYADASRQLPHADPGGRSLLISCGAAVFNLRVAAAHLGFRPRLRLVPDADDAALVAVAEFDRGQPTAGALARYYDELSARRTNRRPFQDRPLPYATLAALTDAAHAEGAQLHVFDDADEVSRIVDLIHDADLVDRSEARAAERRRWMHESPGDDGIPVESLGPRPVNLRSPFRDLGPRGMSREDASFEAAPLLAVLSTPADRPIDWMRSGQALERLLLEATVAGVSASFLNQPLEQHDLRWLVRNPLTGIGHSHMVLRLGYGVDVPATPRRPLAEVLREPRRAC